MGDGDLSIPGPGIAKQVYAVALDSINEPELPARTAMDEHKMQELIDNLREKGQRFPISLEKKGDRFEIRSGHRRYLAARQLGWSCIQALIYETGEIDMLEERLSENMLREDLNPGEEARFMYEVQQKYQLDLAGLCKVFHRTESYINSRFELIYGDEAIFLAVQARQIKLGVAHELNRIDDPHYRNYYLQCAIREDPTQRTVQGWVREWRAICQPQAVIEMQPAEPAPQPAATGPVFCCVLCGGNRDPWNFLTVQVHKQELAALLEQLGHSKAQVREILLQAGMHENEVNNYAPVTHEASKTQEQLG